MSAEPTTEKQELEELLAPFMQQPFTTPQMFRAALSFLLDKLREEQAHNSGADTVRIKGAAWMTVTELADYFGYHRVTMTKMIIRYVESGRVRVIQPPSNDTNKREPNRKYCVADVLAVLTPPSSTRSKVNHENAKA